MNRIVKSWKSTVIGVIAIIGLSYKAYTNGGFSVEDFLLLAVGVGFITYKEKSVSNFKDINATVDPDREKPDERG